MKQMNLVGRAGSILFFISVILVSALLKSCEPENSNLGLNLFPSDDSIYMYTDTLHNLECGIISSVPIPTSHTTKTANITNLTNLLGSLKDTITGLSEAQIVTQSCIINKGYFHADEPVDSLRFTLYVADVEGDTLQDVRLQVYELTDSLPYDSVYYSDYDVSGKYDPTPLIDEIVNFRPDSTYEFYLDGTSYSDRIVEKAFDDTTFRNNALYQEEFKGFYITTEPVASEGGAMASVKLGNTLSGLKFRYLPDTISLDTAEYSDYRLYSISFHPYFAQSVNIFNHDYTGTSIESMIDNEDAHPAQGIVQGLGGVNFRIKLPDITEFLDTSEAIAINGARLVFYVVGDSTSGIDPDDYPGNLFLVTQEEDGTMLNVYDYLINSTSLTNFGKLSQDYSSNAFAEPVYYYSFNVGRHLQSIFSGERENSDFVLNVSSPSINTKYIKFWSNYSGEEGGLKLELIYSKF